MEEMVFHSDHKYQPPETATWNMKVFGRQRGLERRVFSFSGCYRDHNFIL